MLFLVAVLLYGTDVNDAIDKAEKQIKLADYHLDDFNLMLA